MAASYDGEIIRSLFKINTRCCKTFAVQKAGRADTYSDRVTRVEVLVQRPTDLVSGGKAVMDGVTPGFSIGEVKGSMSAASIWKVNIFAESRVDVLVISLYPAHHLLDVRPCKSIIIDNSSPFVVIVLRANDPSTEVDRCAAAEAFTTTVVNLPSVLLLCLVVPVEFGPRLESKREAFGHSSFGFFDAGTSGFQE